MKESKRPPIVTVLGHVDHGKTSLLDALRQTNIQGREAGGITQGIGASVLKSQEGTITFVDTPGHAAFSQMRARGAKVADIVLLVVAADDGVMPQTKEAISYIRESETPMIVVITKIDLPAANIERAISQLEEEGIFFEGRGGTIPWVKTSIKTKEGLNELLELIELMAQVEGISGDPEGDLEAIVIETNKDKRGAVVSVVVRNGTLKSGQVLSSQSTKARVRGIFGERNQPVKEVLPGYPALILGFTDLPQVGESLVGDHKDGKATTNKLKEEPAKKFFAEVSDKQLGLVVKAASAGSLEALLASLPADAVVIDSSVGEVSESDVFFAKTSGATILTFGTKAPSGVKKLADTEGVKIETFDIIYKLLERVSELVEAKKLHTKGEAEIVDIFPYEKLKVAGCRVQKGEIKKGDRVIIMRGDSELGRATITSLKRGKEDIGVAKAGEDCGIIFKPQIDFNKGDMILSAV